MTLQSTRQWSTRPFLRLGAEMCWQTPLMRIQLTNWWKNIRYGDFPKWNKLPVARTACRRGASGLVHMRGRAWAVVPLTRKVVWANLGQALVLTIMDMKGAGLKHHHYPQEKTTPNHPTITKPYCYRCQMAVVFFLSSAVSHVVLFLNTTWGS